MTLTQQQQSHVEDKQPLVKKQNSQNISHIKENGLSVKELDSDSVSVHSQKPLLDTNADEAEFYDNDDDSEEEIDTRVTDETNNNANDDNHRTMKNISQSKSPTNEPATVSHDESEDVSNGNFSLKRNNSLTSERVLRRSPSKSEVIRLQSMERKMESLDKERLLEESTFFTAPPPLRQSNSLKGNVDSDEYSTLLQPLRPMSTSTGYGATNEDSGDTDSVHSMFRGALDVDILEIPWESDISKVVDIQTGEAEWETNINPVEGGLCVDGWDTNIIEMSKEADKFGPDIWSTAIHELPKDTRLHEEWGTEIARNMTNDADPIDWSTKFNAIEKVEQSKNVWKTLVQKIQNRTAETEQWTTTFNVIGSEPKDNSRKSKWTSKISRRMQDLSLKTDWSTQINRTEKLVEGEIWENKINGMLLLCDDRKTHWNTKFLNLQKEEEELTAWNTLFNDIAPREIGEPEIWDATFYSISEERDLPEDWNTTFTSIEQPVDGNDWSVTIEDIPDDFREPSDWATGFYAIENHEDNAVWDTSFNGLTKDHASERIWTSNFFQADITDITRHEWETNLNTIDKADIAWEVSVNPIINHPTNHPVDKD